MPSRRVLQGAGADASEIAPAKDESVSRAEGPEGGAASDGGGGNAAGSSGGGAETKAGEKRARSDDWSKTNKRGRGGRGGGGRGGGRGGRDGRDGGGDNQTSSASHPKPDLTGDGEAGEDGANGRNGLPKRMMIVQLAYTGTAYAGLQKNPGQVTIEGEVEKAIHQAGLIADCNFGELSKVRHAPAAPASPAGMRSASDCMHGARSQRAAGAAAGALVAGGADGQGSARAWQRGRAQDAGSPRDGPQAGYLRAPSEGRDVPRRQAGDQVLQRQAGVVPRHPARAALPRAAGRARGATRAPSRTLTGAGTAWLLHAPCRARLRRAGPGLVKLNEAASHVTPLPHTAWQAADGRKYLYMIPTFVFREAQPPAGCGAPVRGGPGTAMWRDGKQVFAPEWIPPEEEVQAAWGYRCEQEALRARLDGFLARYVSD